MIRLAAEYTEQAPVTAWGERIALTLACLAIILFSVWLMRRSWVRRTSAHSIPPLPAVPDETGEQLCPPVEGRYLATTMTGDWLDRVVAAGLGSPDRAAVAVFADGVEVTREHGAALWLPRENLVGVSLGSGIAQQVFEAGGIVLLTWNHGGHSLDLGFRADRVGEHVALVDAVRTLCTPTNAAGGNA